jgi:hypothetical protein
VEEVKVVIEETKIKEQKERDIKEYTNNKI